ncbi:MAG: cation diffusion facilitator family transporter [Candidatus Nanoarchaeia archaeon]|nr:cation diffusion facilitator family transporter [Candidatus Nanoarchaeia archaeon]
MIKQKKAEKAIIISSGVSFFLFALKLIAGLLTNGIVLISEALDSFTDLLSMIGSFIGIRISKRKPNKEFNYGFGKAENIVSFLISILIIAAAINIGKMGYDSFFSIVLIENSFLAYLAGFSSMVASAFLSYYLYIKSHELGNELLFINSRERLADVFRGFIVIVSIYFHDSGIFYVQGIVTIVICLAVLFIGLNSLVISTKGLMDSSPDKKIIERINKIIENNPKVAGFHDLRLKKSGSYIFGDVEIHVNKKYSLKEAHSIADDIEKNIKKEFCEIASFIIHVEPNE